MSFRLATFIAEVVSERSKARIRMDAPRPRHENDKDKAITAGDKKSRHRFASISFRDSGKERFDEEDA
jgi:hypothetical protein